MYAGKNMGTLVWTCGAIPGALANCSSLADTEVPIFSFNNLAWIGSPEYRMMASASFPICIFPTASAQIIKLRIFHYAERHW